MSTEPEVRFIDVSRHFGEIRAVDKVNLEIKNGEFFGMLGPSGSGKTTCLRLIAGFEQPTSGHIEIHGKAAEGTPPYERDVNTVFQDYALFPHMNIADNVAYSLLIKGIGKKERLTRADEMLELVKLGGLGKRRPSELSGGQRQRVALVRALINHPRVLLLDEPLGALDLKLREEMQIELKSLQRQVGITFIFVTHDQGEALSMSDRLVVFNEGKIEQIGSPTEIYERPESAFVARFVGSSNVLDGKNDTFKKMGFEACFSLRPEKIEVFKAENGKQEGRLNVRGRIIDIHYHGSSTRYQVALDDGTKMAAVKMGNNTDSIASTGEEVFLQWRHEDMHQLCRDGATQ